MSHYTFAVTLLLDIVIKVFLWLLIVWVGEVDPKNWTV